MENVFGLVIVMPNHVHVLVQPFPGIELQDWLYSVKRFSSTQINKKASLGPKNENSGLIERKGHLWQIESYDRVVRNRFELARTRKYILNNPSKLFPGTYSLKQMAWLDEFALIG